MQTSDAFELSVQDLMHVAAAESWTALRVVYDPLNDEHARWPGADGHAGIEGLERAPGLDRLAWRRRLAVVAACLRPVT